MYLSSLPLFWLLPASWPLFAGAGALALVLLLLFCHRENKVLEWGRWLLIGGIGGNFFSRAVFGSGVDWLWLPALGLPTNAADLATLAGLPSTRWAS